MILTTSALIIKLFCGSGLSPQRTFPIAVSMSKDFAMTKTFLRNKYSYWVNTSPFCLFSCQGDGKARILIGNGIMFICINHCY